MITPPINPQGDRLVLPNAHVGLLRELQESRAAAAREQAIQAVRSRLDWVMVPQDGLDQADMDRLVGDVLDLVEKAVLTDRSRQRDVLREVQANLPAWAALGQALQGESPAAT